MAELFQPTNIIPNVLGEFGQGVADVSQAVTISWQVNGSAPMTAYRIRCYANNGTMGYVDINGTCDPPFFGRDAKGNVVRFSHQIDNPGMMWENGKECTYELTLFWSSTESITTLSKCVFLSRKKPTLRLGAISNPYTSRTLNASATFAQEDGDSVMWVQWTLEDATSGQNVVVDDTGRIYGTPVLAYTYDGLENNRYYSIRCTVGTENGVEITTGGVYFEASYPINDRQFQVDVKPDCRGGMAVKWTPFVNLPLSTTASTGSYSTVDGRTLIQTGGNMVWKVTDGNRMFIPAPWTVVWRGTLLGDATVFSLELYGGALLKAEYDQARQRLDFFYSDTLDMQNPRQFSSVMLLDIGTEFTVALTPTQFNFYGTDLLDMQLTDMSYAWRSITSVSLSGYQRNTFFEILDGDLDTETFQAKYAKPDFPTVQNLVTFGPGTRFLLQRWSYFTSPYNAGSNLNDDGPYLKGYWLYRKEPGRQTMTPVVSGSTRTISIIDYGVRNNAGPFEYYLFTETTDESQLPVFNTTTDPVDFCSWDWVLLSCTKNSAGEYVVQNAYLFGNNVSSGVMSNNNNPNILDNFTRYPLVQVSRNNYRTGTLQSLIGSISGCGVKYADTVKLREEIMGLSSSTNYFFIKDRKGDLIMVRPAGEITMATGDNTVEQEQTMSFPWVEVGSAGRASVYQIV